MARITFSPLVTGASGKAGDAVFASWKGRGYVRKLVTPSNPQSADQNTVRDSMGRLPALWRSLAAQVRAVQDAYAVAYRMSGYNWFVMNNRKVEETKMAGVCTPPNTAIDAPATLAVVDAGSGKANMSWTGGTTGANYKMYILSRDISANSTAKAFTVSSANAVLANVGATQVTLTANHSYAFGVAIEKWTEDEFSEMKTASIALGA